MTVTDAPATAPAARPHHIPNLPEGCAQHLLALLRRASYRNRCRPVVEMSPATIAEALDYHVLTVQRAAVSLAAAGHLRYIPGQWSPGCRYNRTEDVPDRYELPALIIPSHHVAPTGRRRKAHTS